MASRKKAAKETAKTVTKKTKKPSKSPLAVKKKSAAKRGAATRTARSVKKPAAKAKAPAKRTLAAAAKKKRAVAPAAKSPRSERAKSAAKAKQNAKAAATPIKAKGAIAPKAAQAGVKRAASPGKDQVKKDQVKKDQAKIDQAKTISAAKAPDVAAPKVEIRSKIEAPAAAAPKAAAPVAAKAPEPIAVSKAPPGAPRRDLTAPKPTKTGLPEKSVSTESDEANGQKTMKSTGNRQGYKTNDFVVYPAHGVGQIVSIEEQEVAGFRLELFVISFAKDKMTLRVPTAKVAAVGLRKLSEPEAARRSLEILTGRARIKRTMWSRRAQEYEAKINSGDINAIAEVVRDLYRSDAQPEQSYSERQLYEAALDRMAREIAVVQKLSELDALKAIEAQLQKGQRRGVKPEADGPIEAVGAEIEEAA